MKLLLTSGGISNQSIRDAVVELLGKPMEDAAALCIPTAQYGHPWTTPQTAWNFVAGKYPSNMTNAGWKSVGTLELLAIAGMEKARWVPWLDAADVLLVDGGDALYLKHWLLESGLWAELENRPDLVWIGVSAGSMVLTPRIGEYFMSWKPSVSAESTDAHQPADAAFGAVDFSIFPHLNHPDMPSNNLENAQKWFERIGCDAYAMDDGSAISIVDGTRTIITDGTCIRLGGDLS